MAELPSYSLMLQVVQSGGGGGRGRGGAGRFLPLSHVAQFSRRVQHRIMFIVPSGGALTPDYNPFYELK